MPDENSVPTALFNNPRRVQDVRIIRSHELTPDSSVFAASIEDGFDLHQLYWVPAVASEPEPGDFVAILVKWKED
jgi:hypothetical protein